MVGEVGVVLLYVSFCSCCSSDAVSWPSSSWLSRRSTLRCETVDLGIVNAGADADAGRNECQIFGVCRRA